MTSFSYKAVLGSDGSAQVVSLIASQAPPDRPLRAVVWSARREGWIFAPAPAARMLYDDRNFDRTQDIDRTEAEKIALTVFRTPLPDEDTLERMCDEGAAAGWRYGPPQG